MYDRYADDREKLEALDAWARTLTGIIENKRERGGGSVHEGSVNVQQDEIPQPHTGGQSPQ